ARLGELLHLLLGLAGVDLAARGQRDEAPRAPHDFGSTEMLVSAPTLTTMSIALPSIVTLHGMPSGGTSTILSPQSTSASLLALSLITCATWTLNFAPPPSGAAQVQSSVVPLSSSSVMRSSSVPPSTKVTLQTKATPAFISASGQLTAVV